MSIHCLSVSDVDTKLNDCELENIVNKIQPQPFTSIFTEDSINDLTEYILYTINDYIDKKDIIEKIDIYTNIKK